VAQAAAKAKAPLIAAGAAMAGVGGGLLLKDRMGGKSSRNPIKKLKGVSLPRPNGKLDLSKIDLETVKSAAERVNSLSQQAYDIAATAEKARKKQR
jgi:hypothetical protein